MTPNPFDVKKLLQVFQNTWIHMMTLQELIETDDERTYDDVRPKYEKEAEHKFALFYSALEDPEAFARAVRNFQNIDSKSGPTN